MNSVDPVAFRQRFPVLADTVHLAGCSQGPGSTELDAALERMRASLREHGAPWGEWMSEVEHARARFAALINATPDEIAIVPNASIGAYQAVSTMDFTARPEIVTTDLEFPSVAHVWLAQRPRGAKVTHVPETAASVIAADYSAAIGERTSLVSVPLVSYRNGTRLDVAAVTRTAHDAGARVFVDAYQGAGVVGIDVRALDCDYLVSGTLKYLLGLPGLAFLYVRAGLTDPVPPSLTGWFGRTDPFSFDPRLLDFPAEARRFDTGTPAVPAVYAANAGLALVHQLDSADVERHVRVLVDRTTQRLTASGFRLYLPQDPASRGPQVAVYLDDPEGAGAWLAERRIVASPRGSVVRLSFHYYNTLEDVDAVCEALAEYQRVSATRQG